MNRRSREFGRKRTRSLALEPKDICETIPMTLSPSERLAMLIEQCYRHAISEVKKEFMHNEDFDVSTFQEKSMECWKKIKASIDEENLVNLAVSENRHCDDSLTNCNIKEYEETIAQFNSESDKWREEMSQYRESLRNKMNSPYEIHDSDWKGSDQLYDYSNITEYVSAANERSKQIGSMTSVNFAISDCLQVHQQLSTNFKKKIEKYLSPADQSSPRTIIKNMAKTAVTKP